MGQPGASERTRQLPEQLLSVDEAAHALGLSPFTVRVWARVRRIPCRRLGRRVLFHPVDLESVVAPALVPARREDEPHEPHRRPRDSPR
jgi:excisionase family DNA binding protein